MGIESRFPHTNGHKKSRACQDNKQWKREWNKRTSQATWWYKIITFLHCTVPKQYFGDLIYLPVYEHMLTSFLWTTERKYFFLRLAGWRRRGTVVSLCRSKQLTRKRQNAKRKTTGTVHHGDGRAMYCISTFFAATKSTCLGYYGSRTQKLWLFYVQYSCCMHFLEQPSFILVKGVVADRWHLAGIHETSFLFVFRHTKEGKYHYLVSLIENLLNRRKFFQVFFSS